MGRCPYRVGISESGTKVVKSTAKKRMPPREKNADVLSSSLTNTDPMITDMIKKELEMLNKACWTAREGQTHRICATCAAILPFKIWKRRTITAHICIGIDTM
jgi:hypothetical protein